MNFKVLKKGGGTLKDNWPNWNVKIIFSINETTEREPEAFVYIRTEINLITSCQNPCTSADKWVRNIVDDP